VQEVDNSKYIIDYKIYFTRYISKHYSSYKNKNIYTQMEKDVWHCVAVYSPKTPFIPHAYFAEIGDAIKYRDTWNPSLPIYEVESPKQLEHKIDFKTKLKASFRFESHAMKFLKQKWDELE
jgi:hypothetical protein